MEAQNCKGRLYWYLSYFY